jgi:hypothetical protein
LVKFPGLKPTVTCTMPANTAVVLTSTQLAVVPEE